ncbi:MAG: 50S ribosomal protein L6 [Spirochaetes bacterium]|nr:50S ribosomal protein L6 [Spirochaetota bacterium]
MSRIAKRAIPIPAGVEVSVNGTTVTVKGKLGSLTQTFSPKVLIKVVDNAVTVTAPDLGITDKERLLREIKKNYSSFLGLTWKIIRNMIDGVTKGFTKVLLLEGVGYRASIEGTTLLMKLGYSHDVRLPIPQGLKIEVDKGQVTITIQGANKDMVGEFSAFVRKQRTVEPYKGKGVRYQGEHVRRKEGKAAAK